MLKRSVKRIIQNSWESIAYRLSSKKNFDGILHHVIFVCKGNICRSPFAEYFFRSLDTKGDLKIESCGIEVGKKIQSPSEVIRISKEFGIDLNTHFSKGLSACDHNKADLIVPMEYNHYLQLISLFPEYKNKIRVLRDFAPFPYNLLCNIYDPFNLGQKEYRRCFSNIEEALKGLFSYCSRGDFKK